MTDMKPVYKDTLQEAWMEGIRGGPGLQSRLIVKHALTTEQAEELAFAFIRGKMLNESTQD